MFQCRPKTIGVFGKSVIKEDKYFSARRGDGGNRFGNRRSHTKNHTNGIQRLHNTYNRSSFEHYYGF